MTVHSGDSDSDSGGRSEKQHREDLLPPPQISFHDRGSERHLLREELDRAFAAAEESQQWPKRQSRKQRERQRYDDDVAPPVVFIARKSRRPPTTQETGARRKNQSASDSVNESEWSAFLGGLNGDVRRAAAQTEADAPAPGMRRRRRRRSSSLGNVAEQQRLRPATTMNMTFPRSASMPLSSSGGCSYNSSRAAAPKSILRRGRFSAINDDEFLFVDKFLARSLRRLQVGGNDSGGGTTNEQLRRGVRFRTPAVYHLSRDGGYLLDRIETSWTAARGCRSSDGDGGGSPSVPRMRTDVMTYARRQIYEAKEEKRRRHRELELQQQTTTPRWQTMVPTDPSGFAAFTALAATGFRHYY